MKESVLVDIRIEVDPPNHISWYADKERAARLCERWAAEFMEFVRDHRSQDPVQMNVIRVMRDQCSHCGCEWEVDAEGPLCCEKAQDEWQAAKATPA